MCVCVHSVYYYFSSRGLFVCLCVVWVVAGVGKGTLLSMFQQEFGAEQVAYAVSHTTRAPRPGEMDGVNYHFVSKDVFEDLVEKNLMLEHAKVYCVPDDIGEGVSCARCPSGNSFEFVMLKWALLLMWWWWRRCYVDRSNAFTGSSKLLWPLFCGHQQSGRIWCVVGELVDVCIISMCWARLSWFSPTFFASFQYAQARFVFWRSMCKVLKPFTTRHWVPTLCSFCRRRGRYCGPDCVVGAYRRDSHANCRRCHRLV